jgi:DNA-directed RNA polymerase specialized sigma24 family protein
VLLRANPQRGRFRSFLLTSLQNFLVNEWKAEHTVKRGGGQVLSLDFASGESRFQSEPAHDQTPEKLYERGWVITLLDTVLATLQRELAAAGKGTHFETRKTVITAEAGAVVYQRAGEALGVSAAAAKQEAYRMRKRYRQIFRQEWAKTLEDPGEVDDEIARLLESLRG